MKRLIYIIHLLIIISSCTKETLQNDTIEEPIFENVIYLDFNGGNLQDNSWNNGESFYVGSSGLNESDQNKVIETIKGLFSQFQVTVTKKGAIYNETAIDTRQRVIITTSYEWYGDNAAGAAIVNSWGSGTPVFVFPKFANSYAPTIGKAICHELGHSLGLYHQSVYSTECVLKDELREGCIMGKYYGNSSWVIGQSQLGCDSIQNDLQIISETLKLK